MKIQLARDVLADAVQWAARTLPTRPSVPVLNGLLIRADSSGVTLSTFDYETSARIDVEASVTDEGEALVSGRLLADISRSLPNRDVHLSSDGQKVELTCGTTRFSLQCLPLDEYPSLPAMPEQTGTVPSAAFAEAVAQVVVAAGRDELLPVFTGVRMEIEGDTLSLLATDRYRMALKEIEWSPGATDLSANALIPARVLSETAKSMTNGDQISLSLSASSTGEGMIGFEGTGPGGVRHTTTRLLDGEFPKVRHIMNLDGVLHVRLSTADLMGAVRRIALVAERNTSLRMVFEDGSVVLSAATGDQAQGTEGLEATIEQVRDNEIVGASFNPSYLADALGAFTTPYVDFAFTAPGKPCLVTGLQQLDGETLGDYRHVIMLMREPA